MTNIVRLRPTQPANSFATLAHPARDRRARTPRARSFRVGVEHLEVRALLAAGPSHLPFVATPPIETLGPVASPSVAAPVGATPAQIAHAYSFDAISFGGGIRGDGTGQTIAIVDAYNQPNVVADLNAFDAQFGLADPPSFRVVAQDGSANLPPVASRNNWGIETSMDVEWAHALAPGASLLLVEANSASTDLYTAVAFAAAQPGVSVVSMSWGSPEFSGENAYDGYFLTPAGHAGVTFLAATGDAGSPGDYPAASPNVLAVGGTLFPSGLDTQGNYPGESGWSGSGGGVSPFEGQPAYQKAVVSQTSTARAIPDVAFDAWTGVAVYDTYDGSPMHPWFNMGGTSLATPCWAALVAIADQGAAAVGRGTLADGAAIAGLYGLAAAPGSGAFHDITAGNNGFPAGPGYDLVTGLGTPVAPAIATGLSGNVAAPTPIAPTGQVINTAPTFRWSAVAGAQSYHLVAYDQATSTAALDVVVGGVTSYTPPGPVFLPGHAYSWRVSAVAGAWPTGIASGFLGFNLPAVAPPTLTSPAPGAVVSTATPTLQWSAVAGAAFYGVTLVDQANPLVRLLSLAPALGTSYTLTTPLLAGHTYVWTVQAFLSSGGTGYYGPPAAAPAVVVAPLAAPGLLAPAAGSAPTATSPTFLWSAVAGAVSYSLVVDDLTSGTNALSVAGVAGTSYTPSTPLVVGHAYRWRVTAVDPSGNPGTSPAPGTFSIAPPAPPVAPPSLSNPSGVVSTTLPALHWSPVAGASGYGVQIVDQSAGPQGATVPLLQASGTTYNVGTPLVAGHTYTWQVLAYNANGLPSGWSAPLQFTVKDRPTADFDGVGRSEISVFTPTWGGWTVVNPVTGAVRTTIFGGANYATIPAPGDYDGVGRTEMAVFIPATATWMIWNPNTLSFSTLNFGIAGQSIPVPADYDGIGRAEPAVYIPSTGLWAIYNPLTGASRTVTWGYPNVSIPAPADYDGIGRAELTLYTPSTASWMVWNPVAGTVRTVGFGVPNNGSLPAPGDYDGVGHAEMAVFAPATATWTIWNPVTNAMHTSAGGAYNLHDIPLAASIGGVATPGLFPYGSTPITPKAAVAATPSPVPSGPAATRPAPASNPTPPAPSAVKLAPVASSWRTIGQSVAKPSWRPLA